MYKTSTDYERLWDLIQPTEKETTEQRGILWRQRGHYLLSNKWHICPNEAIRPTKEAFISYCKNLQVEFIDPASQQKTPAELAAGEMADVLQWALDAMPISSFHAEYVHHYCVALAEKTEEVLKKARGEE